MAPVTPKKTKGRGKVIKKQVSVVKTETVDDYEAWLKSKNLLKPDDQLDLTEKELQEEVARVLTTLNPRLPVDHVQFSFKFNKFVPAVKPPHLITMVHSEGACLHIDSPEAMAQIEAEGWAGVEEIVEVPVVKKKRGSGDEEDEDEEEESIQEEEPAAAEVEAPNVEPETEAVAEAVAVAEEGEEGADDEEKGEDVEVKADDAPTGKKKKKLTNQFNFCDRAALTYSNPFRELSTQTSPPPRATMSGYITQWLIFDAYQEDFEIVQREKERERREKMTTQVVQKKEEPKRRRDKLTTDPSIERMLQATKILERMVNQNSFDEISQDYKYYEDPSDEYREGEGTLLPLWKFYYEKTKGMSVTDIAWNPDYYDLFGVTFGSFDFSVQKPEGYFCLFTMKNPSYPEYINMIDCGAMCLDFHPKYPYFVIVGHYDGNISVYNVSLTTRETQYRSLSVTNKHAGVVWQVVWGPDLQDGEMNFYSIASDGKVYNWVLMQNELAQTLVITLFLDMDSISGPDGTMIKVTGCGTAIAFHPKESLIFLVGTEEGRIYKCSIAYASIYLFTYEAHHMPVHKIDYNQYNPEIFLSCSADWRVKIWEDNRSEPLFVFDLGCSVGDVKWAPYSSTVFAAVTVDGKCHVFDLNVNKYKAVCVQSIVSRKRNKLTRLAFNYKMPIIMLGDERGFMTTVKLSPNLRIKPKPPKKQAQVDRNTLEIWKLDKLLALVREPQKLTAPVDTETTVS